MNYEPFLIRCKEKFPKEECLDTIVDKMSSVFSDEEFRHNAKACELFYITQKKIGKAQFFRIKKYVKELYEWLFEQGKVTKSQVEYVSSLTMDDVISDDEIRHCYFKSLDDALNFVRAVGRRCGLSEEDDLLIIKTIVVLSWHGVERAEMANIKKADLSTIDNTVRLAMRTIELQREHFEVLRRLSVLDIHRGFPSGKRQVFEYSQYLMRAQKSTKLDKEKISQAVKRFNSIAIDQFGHRLSTKALQNNGIFYRLLWKESEGAQDLTSLIKDVAGCNKHAVFWYKVMYEKWKNIFYPDVEVGG